MTTRTPSKFVYPGTSADSLEAIATWHATALGDDSPVDHDLICLEDETPIAQWCNGCLERIDGCKRVNLCEDSFDLCKADGSDCGEDCELFENETFVFCLPSKYFDSGSVKLTEQIRCCTIPGDSKETQPEPRQIEIPITLKSPNAESQGSQLPAGDWKYQVCRTVNGKQKIGPSGFISVRS